MGSVHTTEVAETDPGKESCFVLILPSALKLQGEVVRVGFLLLVGSVHKVVESLTDLEGSDRKAYQGEAVHLIPWE